MRHAPFFTGLALGLVLCACQSEKEPASAPAPSASATPDRLAPDENLNDAPVAFGMPLPSGMHLTRYFTDAAYFSGRVRFEDALAHVRQHVLARDVEMRTRRAVIPQAYIRGDEKQRLFRIAIESTSEGSQVHIQDITPPPVAQGLSDAERWRRAGRNPDGTLLNPKEVF
jgi:hypothetical protein